ncbi:MAG UNVERIFIED_CONTAM: hypothetical protein LVR29_18425 [Microcystis novacekii LVE1205-3]
MRPPTPFTRSGGGAGGGFNYQLSDRWIASLGYSGNHADPIRVVSLFNGQYAESPKSLGSILDRVSGSPTSTPTKIGEIYLTSAVVLVLSALGRLIILLAPHSIE